jgi:hypothetical protein
MYVYNFLIMIDCSFSFLDWQNVPQNPGVQVWNDCFEAINRKDDVAIREIKIPHSLDFWDKALRKSTLLDLAASRCRDLYSESVFIHLHREYAGLLHQTTPEDWEKRASNAILKVVKSENPHLLGMFRFLISTYFPTTPRKAFITNTTCDTCERSYKTNQFFFADWCYAAGQTLIPSIKEHAFTKALSNVGLLRHQLAKFSKSNSWEDFGIQRTTDLWTPLTDDYKPWHDYCHKRWMLDPNTCIWAVGPDGKKVPGTTFGVEQRPAWGSQPLLSWKHSIYPSQLHAISEQWFQRTVNIGECKSFENRFLRCLGAFFHTMCQYTAFRRGSAACSIVFIQAILLRFKRPLPEATTLLDCYALSMQQEEFIERIFLPWCSGVHDINILQDYMYSADNWSAWAKMYAHLLTEELSLGLKED